MALAYINFRAKQYFNFMCNTEFERRIFHDTYREFQKKSKSYSLNQHLNTFSQMLEANEKAKGLHQKLHYSVMKTIDALENKMPVLQDIENKSILFSLAELHICSSDLLNKAVHVVSLTYTSPRLVLHELVGDLMVLSYDVKGNFNETFIVKMTDALVVNYEQHQDLVCSSEAILK